MSVVEVATLFSVAAIAGALARAWHLASIQRFGPDVVSDSIRRDAKRNLTNPSRLLR